PLIDDKIDPSKEPIELNKMYGDCNNKTTKIWPMKVMKGKQPYDPVNKTFVYVKLFGKKGSGALWSDFDWERSAEEGMKYAGKPFSGKIDFIETKMYWPISHMVSPKEDALKCSECHSRNGRLKDMDSCWIPGRDRIEIIDILGFLSILGVLFGVLIHSSLRLFFGKKFKK
ncbi:MAG: cytochrome C, partial [Candidatus Aminicenantes bacterium]|nr:cytochrome C [Candidatus Aminicenantes bacterium]